MFACKVMLSVREKSAYLPKNAIIDVHAGSRRPSPICGRLNSYAALGLPPTLNPRRNRMALATRLADLKDGLPLTWTDEELVARSIGGDADSFNELVVRWERPIYALAYRSVARTMRETCVRDVSPGVSGAARLSGSGEIFVVVV